MADTLIVFKHALILQKGDENSLLVSMKTACTREGKRLTPADTLYEIVSSYIQQDRQTDRDADCPLLYSSPLHIRYLSK